MTNDCNALFKAFEKKHVLIINDEPHILAEIKMDLMDCFDISIAATSASALTVIEADEISAVAIYIGKNHKNAFSVFADIFNFTKTKNIPIIFIAEKNNGEDETEAFAIGAVDYCVRIHGAAYALAERIRLRIKASEYEKHILDFENVLHSGNADAKAALLNKTILIVDDIELNRTIAAAMLSDIEGLTIELAVDGKEAVEKFAKTPNMYSLILMDIQMPVMDGLEATKSIRSLNCENAREIPIIAATASFEEKEIELCFKAGMNDYIAKPMIYNKILNLIAKHCLAPDRGR